MGGSPAHHDNLFHCSCFQFFLGISVVILTDCMCCTGCCICVVVIMTMMCGGDNDYDVWW